MLSTGWSRRKCKLREMPANVMRAQRCRITCSVFHRSYRNTPKQRELDAATCPIPKPNPDLGIADAVTQAGSDTAQAGSASTSSGAAQATPSVASKLAEKSPAQQVASAVIRGNFRLAHDLAKQNSKTDPNLWLQAGSCMSDAKPSSWRLKQENIYRSTSNNCWLSVA